jgi:hypothetical protein
MLAQNLLGDGDREFKLIGCGPSVAGIKTDLPIELGHFGQTA